MLSFRFLLAAIVAGVSILSTRVNSEPKTKPIINFSTDTPLLGVFVGSDPAEAIKFEEWLGRRTEGVQVHTGRADWPDWQGSIGWLAGLWIPTGRTVFWSIPLIPKNGADLSAAAQGKYISAYKQAAQTLTNAKPKGQIFIRTGWEFNGDWMPWSAINNEKDFIDAFRVFVTSFREVSDRFIFEWCPNIGEVGMNPELAYPGDKYVDIIGLDFYYFPQWNSSDPNIAWNKMRDQKYGLGWHQIFASNHGKPTSYSEWGIALDNSAPYIFQAAQWFKDHKVVYHAYWDSDADFPGKLSSGHLINSGNAFRDAFGKTRHD